LVVPDINDCANRDYIKGPKKTAVIKKDNRSFPYFILTLYQCLKDQGVLE